MYNTLDAVPAKCKRAICMMCGDISMYRHVDVDIDVDTHIDADVDVDVIMWL